MNPHEALGLGLLLQSMSQLKRFTFIHLAFRSSADIVSILEVIDNLKANKSLIKFSLNFEKCKISPFNRLQELFLTLKEIKSLENSEIFFKECDIPGYPLVKALIPFIKEISQNQNISIKFENYRHVMTRYERLLFIKSIQNTKSSHRVQVQFIENIRIAHRLKSSFLSCGSGMVECLTVCCKSCTFLPIYAIFGFVVSMTIVLLLIFL